MKSELLLRTTEALGTILMLLCLFALITSLIVSTFAFDLGMTIGLFAGFGLLLSSLPMNIRNL